jgi:glycosyltransferase involved in cell wall biosynthesis
VKAFSKADLFLFPTLGENFGYVIAEALQAGCPVLISDRTPWQGLEARGAGWVVPLEDEDRFVEILQRCADLDGEGLDRLSASAYEFGRTLLDDSEEVEANRRVIERALSAAPGGRIAD